MELVALVGADRESWGQITGLINRGSWEKIVLIRAPGSNEYVPPCETTEITLDSTRPLLELKQDLLTALKSRLTEFEACVSIASGTGKEHMALISALLSIPMGIRLVAFTKNGIEFIT